MDRLERLMSELVGEAYDDMEWNNKAGVEAAKQKIRDLFRELLSSTNSKK